MSKKINREEVPSIKLSRLQKHDDGKTKKRQPILQAKTAPGKSYTPPKFTPTPPVATTTMRVVIRGGVVDAHGKNSSSQRSIPFDQVLLMAA